MSKEILDPACGSRMMWFDKNNPNAVFCDIRKENHILCDGRTLSINPDIQTDFRQLPFEDNTFSMVVFDPPHLKKLGQSSWMAKKYGVLQYSWKDDLKEGFSECMRVLKPNGTLIFKWNAEQIKVSEILEVIGKEPLFGHKTRKNKETIWMVFMKLSD